MTWPQLQSLQQARKLESDLEVKLSAFSKLTNRLDSGERGEAGLAADQVSLTQLPCGNEPAGQINKICSS